jgi:hypothetical protein
LIEPKPERRSLSLGAGDANLAAMLFNQLTNDPQSEPRRMLACSGACAQPLQAPEYLFFVLFGQSRSFIPNLNPDPSRFLFRRYPDIRSRRAVFNSVRD